MKYLLTVLLIAICFLGITKAQSKMAVGAGLVVSLPMGDFADLANTGFGGTAAFELKFQPQLVGVGQIGYISYGTESEAYSFSSVPFLVGVKYFFQPGSGFYGIGKLGLNFFSTTIDIPSYDFFGSSFGGGSTSASSTEFTFAVGAGYEMPISKNLFLDVAGTFNLLSDFSNIQLRVGVKTGI